VNTTFRRAAVVAAALALAGCGTAAAPAAHQAPASHPAPTITKTVTATPKATHHPKAHHPKAHPQPAAPAQPAMTNGVSVVSQYYQDITDGNYQAAWAIGGSSIAAQNGQSYGSWVAGYSTTTASIDITSYGTWSDGTVWCYISAVQLDGSVRSYYGTYQVSNGVIVSANISQVG
jgi:hypothetical protein